MLFKLYEMMYNDEEKKFKEYLEECCQERKLYDIATLPLEDDSTLLYQAVILEKLWAIEHIFNHLDRLEQKNVLSIAYDIQLSESQGSQKITLKEIANLTSPKIYIFLKEKELMLSPDESMKNLEIFLDKKKSSKIESPLP